MSELAILNPESLPLKSGLPAKIDQPFDPNDPSWIAGFSHIYLHTDNYKELVDMFFDYDLVEFAVHKYFFNAEVHTDIRFPRYYNGLMVILGIRKGEEWRAENLRVKEEIEGYLKESIIDHIKQKSIK